MNNFCEHPRTEVRYRYNQAGAKTIKQQCMDCGYPVGSFISQKDKPHNYLESLPPWDDVLQKATQEGNRHKVHEDMEHREEERAAMNSKWWAWYNAYLRTPEWREKRRWVLERDNHLCTGCRLTDATQVHHLTYEHVGNELLFELTSVCQTCHDKAHERSERGGPPSEVTP